MKRTILTKYHVILAALLILPLGATAATAKVHTSSLPKDVALPSATHNYAYLEGERPQKPGDEFKDAPQKQRTFFCTANIPNDKWCSSTVLYDKSRFGLRGADKNLPWHKFTWDLAKAKLTKGVYDAYARIMVTPGGSCELGITTGKTVPAKTTKTDQHNIFWQRVGSLEINAQTQTVSLYMQTKQSAVRLDTLLLVKVVPEEAAVGFLRHEQSKECWKKGKGIVFSGGSGQVVYRAEHPEMVRNVKAAICTVPGQKLVWKTIPANEKGEWALPSWQPGWYDVHVNAELQDGKVLNRHFTAAVLGTPLPDELRQKSVFGLWNVHGDTELIKLAGARWNRRMTSFRSVTEQEVASMPAQGKTPYTNKDGLEYLGVFSFGMPLWSMKLPEGYKPHGFGNPFCPAKDWKVVSSIVQTFARQKDLPETIEMYNEPLAHWKGSKPELVAYAKAVREGLKAADPKYKLAGPCLYSIRIGDLNALAKAGLFKQLDAISMHAYVNGTPPEGEFLDRIIQLNELLKEYGQQQKPVYLTEFGWTAADGTWQPPVDRNTQTSYVARSLALGWSQKIDAMVFFVLKYDTSNQGEAGFSLMDSENRPQPGYVAFSAVSKFFAGSEPFGHFQLSPDVHLVAGQRDGKLQLALWSTDKPVDISLPFKINAAFDVFGKELEVDSQKITCTENPVYLEATAAGMKQIVKTDPITITNVNPLPENMIWPLAGMNKDLSRMATGQYAGFIKTGSDWTIQPVNIVAPLTIKDTQVVWPLDKAAPQLKVTVSSNLKNKSQQPLVWIDNSQKTKLEVPPNCIRQIAFPLTPFVEGQKTSTRISLQSDNDQPLSSVLTWTVLSATNPGSSDAWTDFTDWEPFGDHGQGGLCQGQVKMTYDTTGITLQVRVTDEDHHQPNAPDKSDRLWAGDSVQVSFDMDVLKPWSAGVVGAGLSGHRVFEYSIGAADSGKAQVFRERSYTEGLPDKVLEPRAEATFKRDGNVSLYRILFPWECLGVKTPLPKGSVFGFALAINDVDPKRKNARHGLRLYKGIVASKNAREFGKVWLR